MTPHIIDHKDCSCIEVKIQTFQELTTHELYAILKARAAVFVVEQNCQYQDMDGTDFEATHVTLWNGNEIVAYARVFVEGTSGKWHIGRVLTIRRGMGYGIPLMNEAINVAKEAGAKVVEIDAQSYAIGFYEKVGFCVCSEEYLIDNILHKRMRLNIDSTN